MKILLIDDHKLIVEGLKNSLAYNLPECVIDCVSELSNFSIDSVAKKYDLIILDINLNKIGSVDGLSLAKKILKLYPDKKICFLTGFDLPGYENEARKIGARGFISKEISTSELIDAISRILKGELFFTKKQIWMEELTKKEKEILQLYCQGHSRKDIVIILGISMRTLANHLNSIYEKLDVSNYQEMIRKAMRLGYILPKGGI